jgi:glycosyltransferase involved in cell wall biosynthesis
MRPLLRSEHEEQFLKRGENQRLFFLEAEHVLVKREIMGSGILLSIALATRNRPESLRRCLKSLQQQSVRPFEIVVSDDSDESYSEFTRAIALDHGCRYLAGPRRGLYANRNFVAQHCRGTHIRTVDDDHVLSRDHLAQCRESIELDPGAVWTTGECGYLGGKLIGTTARANQLHPSGVGGPIENPDDNWGISDGSTIYPGEVSFKEVGEHMTVLLARSIIFESVYADQGAVLEIVRQALLNAPERLHAQIVAAAIVSVTDPERLVIIEVAGPVPGPDNLERTDSAANPLAQEGPLAYRLAETGETGALALGIAILAVATSVDPNLDLTQFPIALDGYFLPGFNPPGFAASGPYDLGEPINQRILDPRLPLVSPSPSPVPVIPTPSPPSVRRFPSPPPVSTPPVSTPTPISPTPSPTPITRRPTPTPTPVSP